MRLLGSIVGFVGVMLGFWFIAGARAYLLPWLVFAFLLGLANRQGG